MMTNAWVQADGENNQLLFVQLKPPNTHNAWMIYLKNTSLSAKSLYVPPKSY